MGIRSASAGSGRRGCETSVLKVAGGCLRLSELGADSLRVSVKCEPELAEALHVARAVVIPGYLLNKRLEHRDHRRLAIRRDHPRDDRGLIRPGCEQAAARPIAALSAGTETPSHVQPQGCGPSWTRCFRALAELRLRAVTDRS
jgi:hypothetical protein